MRRILFHVPKLGSGGLERLEEQWRPIAEKYGIQYVFSVVESGGELYDLLVEKGYKIYKIKKLSEVGFIGFIKQFSHIIKAEEIYGVHVPASPTSSFILLAAMLAGCRLRILHSQTKLVRVIKGNVYDVIIDCRKKSKTFGKWFGIELSENNKKQLLIPKGLAHGFLVLSDVAEFVYKVDDYYSPNDEIGVIWNDPDVAIDWPGDKTGFILAQRDLKWPHLKESCLFIE